MGCSPRIGSPVHHLWLRRLVEHACNAQTADQIKSTVEELGNVGMPARSSTRAFARVTEVRFGNVGRNTMRGPGVVNLDLSLFRGFKLNDRFNLQFRAGGVQREQHAAFRQSGATSTAPISARSSPRTVIWPPAARGSSASGCTCCSA